MAHGHGTARRFSMILAAMFVFMFVRHAFPDGVPPRSSLITRPSTHNARETIDRFTAAVREAGWVVFTEIDHAAAARAAGMTLPPRVVVLFGNPAAGTPAMQEHPSLAIDLPMRVLVWENATGRVEITRNTGAYVAEHVFGRHGIALPPSFEATMDLFMDGLMRKATE